jgi:serine/threonine protein kinase
MAIGRLIGETLSHYKILGKIGEGGMGEVYLAEDLKLKRRVALKILPAQIAVNKTDKARFLQEAQAAAAINHANVCVIYEVEEQGDAPFIAMEYVEGKTLREKIKDQRLEIKEAVDYAIQIASALQAAHGQGIIHRDIKTDNIMITTAGQVKIMDFGLAKIKGALRLTRSTSTLGTLAYMSPEQLEGREIDGRSDIFSFGVVLYEMLSGQLPFQGDYESTIIFAILNEEPEPIQELCPDISNALQQVLDLSLQKKPDDRYQRIEDLLFDLKQAGKGYQTIATKPVKSDRRAPKKIKRKRITPIKGVIAVSILIIIFALLYLFNPFSSKQKPSLMPDLFAGLNGNAAHLAFSPDGRQLAFAWNGEEEKNDNIYIKSLGTDSLRRLTNYPGDDYVPVWSPDGRQIAFIRNYQEEWGIYTVPVEGGSESPLYKGNWMRLGGLSWSPDSKHIAIAGKFAVKDIRRIYLFSINTHELKKITNPPIKYIGDFFCTFSPDGSMIAFMRYKSWRVSEIHVVSLADGEERQLTFDNKEITGLTWAPDSKEIIFSTIRSGLWGLWRLLAKGGEVKPLGINGMFLLWPVISQQGNRLAYVDQY